jgi:hypothetical protein
MPSVTTWTRLEIGTRNADPGPGLEARVYDPLWTLGRQWQLGEFAAVDGGTPTIATLTVNQASVDRFRASTPGADPSVVAEKVGPGAPIEPLIERERGVPDLRLRAQLGRDLVRALIAAGRAADAQRLTASASLTSDDPAATGLVAVLGDRVPDALTLRGTLDAEIAAADAPLKALLTAWRDRFDALVPARAPLSWRTATQEHAFSMQAAGAPTLVADGERGEPLDWWAFDAAPQASLGSGAGGTATTLTAVPRLTRYAGMPATRFWQFEDTAVSFGQVDVDPTDLGRMLLIEFALGGADDWHVIPVPIAVGAVATVAQLRVLDTFGRVTDIEPVDDGPAAGPHWRMFRVTSSDDGAQALPLVLVVPSAGAELLGDPVEDLRLARDEQANLAWAIERVVPDARGDATTVDGGPVVADPRAVAPAVRAYVVQTPVPAGWTPLVPRPSANGVLELDRGTLAADPAAEPAGRLALEIVALREEALPREGLTVRRRWHVARWVDGSLHSWVGREVLPGAGEPESGLAFDRLR